MNTAKLFKNGKSQAVRLPKQFRFQGTEVYIKRVVRSVILMPKDDPWESLTGSLDNFSDDFMDRSYLKKRILVQYQGGREV